MSGSGSSYSDSSSSSESEADIPILIPVPFQELSSIQYYTTEEQLLGLTAALKEQFPRHCFIKIHSEKTQPLLVPFVEQFYTPPENHQWYESQIFAANNALSADQADALIAEQETVLVQASQSAAPVIDVQPASQPEVLPPLETEAPKPKRRKKKDEKAAAASPWSDWRAGLK